MQRLPAWHESVVARKLARLRQLEEERTAVQAQRERARIMEKVSEVRKEEHQAHVESIQQHNDLHATLAAANEG